MSYSRGYTFLEILQDFFMPKRKYLIDIGYYDTMSGSWRNGHGNIITRKQYKNCSLKELKTLTKGD